MHIPARTTFDFKFQTLNLAGFAFNGVKFLLFIFPVALPLCIHNAAMDKSLLPPFLFIAVFTSLCWTFLTYTFFFNKEKKPVSFSVRSLWMLAPFFGFVSWSWLTAAYAPVFAEGLFDMVKWTLLLSLFLLFSVVFSIELSAVKALQKGIIISALITSIAAAYEIAKLIPEIFLLGGTAGVESFFGHKNLLASWLVFISLLIVPAIFQSGRYFRWLGSVALLLSLFCIIVLQTRAAWVAFSVALFLIVCVYTVIRRDKTKLRAFLKTNRLAIIFILFSFLVSLFTILFLAYPGFFTKEIPQYMGVAQKDEDGKLTKQISIFRMRTVYERFYVWRKTLLLIKEKPLLGHGSGSWQLLFPKYGLENSFFEQGDMTITRPHNDYLWIWAEKGIAGLLLYVSALALPVFFALKKIWVNSTEEKVQLLFPAALLISFAVNELFDFPIERPAHLSLFVIALSMLFFSFSHSKNKYVRLPAVIFPLLLIISLSSAWLISKRLSGEIYTRKAVVAGMKKNYPAAEENFQKAVSFVYTVSPTSIPLAYHLGFIYSENNQPEVALQYFKKAQSQHPYYPPLLSNVGITYEQLSMPDSARYYYEQALQIAPGYENALLNMAAHYFNARDLKQSYAYLRKIDPQTKNPRYRPIADIIIKVKLRKVVDKLPYDSPLRKKLELMEEQPDILFNIYMKSKENSSFEKQAIKLAGKN